MEHKCSKPFLYTSPRKEQCNARNDIKTSLILTINIPDKLKNTHNIPHIKCYQMESGISVRDQQPVMFASEILLFGSAVSRDDLLYATWAPAKVQIVQYSANTPLTANKARAHHKIWVTDSVSFLVWIWPAHDQDLLIWLLQQNQFNACTLFLLFYCLLNNYTFLQDEGSHWKITYGMSQTNNLYSTSVGCN